MPPSWLEEKRKAALEAYEAEEVPTWRRSGFWTTTLRKLELDSLEPRRYEARRRAARAGARGHRRRPAGRPDRAARREHHPRLGRPGRGRAGRDRQPLEQAAEEHSGAGAGVVHAPPLPRGGQVLRRQRGVLDRRRVRARAQGRARGAPDPDRLPDRRARHRAVRAHPGGGGRARRVPDPRVLPRHAHRRPGAARRRLRAVRAAGVEGEGRPLPGLGPGRGLRHLHQADRDRARRPRELDPHPPRRAADQAAPGHHHRRGGLGHAPHRALLHRGRGAPRPVHLRQARGRATPPATPCGRARSPATRARRTRG